jgi:FixJ family two-component response regulator
MTIHRPTIAVVDDDPSVLKALGRLLMAAGYRVELFACAADVLDAMPTSQATCLIIDCQLGDISGVELGAHLSAVYFDLPIIFMTGSDDDLIRKQAMAVGCVAYLQKPFVADELLTSIAKANHRRANRPPQVAE